MILQRRLAEVAYRERPTLVPVILLAITAIGLDVVLPWPLKLIIDNVLAGEALPGALSWLADLPGGGSAHGLLIWLAFALLLLFFASQAVSIAKGLFQARTSTRMQMRLGTAVFAKLQGLSLAYHRRARRGDLVRRVTGDTGCVSVLILNVVVPLVTSALSLFILFAIMWQLDQLLASVAALITLPMIWLMRSFAPRMAERAYEYEQAASHMWSVTEQTLVALPVVQAFGREAHEKSRFTGVADRSQRTYLRSLATQLQFNVGIHASEAAGMGALMLVGGVHVLQGSLSVGALIVFLSYVTALYTPLLTLAYLTSTWASATAGARRVAEILDSAKQLEDAPQSKPLRMPRKHGGRIRLEGVEFGYVPGKPVLHGIDLEVAPGEMVALVGPTGAGKSSLVSLIPRFFDPWNGRVSIDGQDVRSVTLASVRDAVSIVLQEPFLLPISIAQNIAYGRRGASREQIEAAARAANADEFIERLPNGYETVIGERGTTLSGGQRQRLAIARAVLKDAPILVMDEPTSALDALTEASVMEALARLAVGRTAVIIAHRLSTLRRADRIAVLSAGQIVETGSHDALMAQSGLYRKLYLSQMLHIELDLQTGLQRHE